MEQFVVSARKYRPATFDTVVGQEAVTSTLKNAIRTDHLASAFLFTGPRGVGKTTCARILARTVNCENRGEDIAPCGECQPCKTFDEGHSLNIFELDAASNNSVDDIRNLILQVSIAPQVGTKKVYIIDEVHMLSSAAFNAFLKTLEEPPSYAIFILATTEKHKILPTILSRCQVFDFRRIMVSDIAEHLARIAKKEGIEAEPQALHTIAQKADGGLRDALSIFDQLVSFSGNVITYKDVLENLNVLDHEHYFRITDSMIRGDIAAALVEYNSILQLGFDGHLFVTGLARHFRDLLVSQDPRTLPLLEVSEDLMKRYGTQAKSADRNLLIAGLDRLAYCDTQYKLSKEPRLLVELALIQLCNAASGGTDSAEKKKSEPRIEPTSDVCAVPKAHTPEAPKPIASPVSASTPKPEVPVAQPAATSSPDQFVPRRRLAGQVSIKAHIDVPVEEAAPTFFTDEPSDLPSGEVQERGQLNQALLNKVWLDYADEQRAKGRSSLHSTLTDRKPVISGIGAISFAIVNEVQERYLKDEMPELLGYLRRALGEPQLELAVIKEEIKVQPRATPLERFKIMAEKNPALYVLRDTLKLDLS